jgi:hypothetical protein
MIVSRSAGHQGLRICGEPLMGQRNAKFILIYLIRCVLGGRGERNYKPLAIRTIPFFLNHQYQITNNSKTVPNSLILYNRAGK